MRRLFRGLALAVAVLTGVAVSQARADKEADFGVMKVEDKAGLFSEEGISKAKTAFENTPFKSWTHLLIVTADQVPPAKQAEWDAIYKAKDEQARNHFAEEWARALGRTKDRHGDIVVLVFKSGSTIFVSTISDKQSDIHRHFGDEKASKVNDLLLRELRKIKTEKLADAAARKEMDVGLMSATEMIIASLKDTSAPDAAHKSGTSNRVAADHRGGSGIGGYICMFLCIGLGIWLVIGLIRAFTGGGGGGYGGGYGGGGGGFFSSLMGGMFGAMAGMWMYNNLLGGFHNDAMAGDSYGSEGGDYGTGDGNYDDGGAATDGDWGDGGGGGDWGGGGGDFGGDFGGDW